LIFRKRFILQKILDLPFCMILI